MGFFAGTPKMVVHEEQPRGIESKSLTKTFRAGEGGIIHFGPDKKANQAW
jgi:hypothetical protein